MVTSNRDFYMKVGVAFLLTKYYGTDVSVSQHYEPSLDPYTNYFHVTIHNTLYRIPISDLTLGPDVSRVYNYIQDWLTQNAPELHI